MMKNIKNPTRKIIRLQNFDYSSNCAYFITICSKDHKWKFGNVLANKDNLNAFVTLSSCGQIIDKYINRIESVYNGVSLVNYVIMPNHVHLILMLYNCEKSVSTIINSTKGMVTREIGEDIWQSRFYDTVIDNYDILETKYNYIENNPINWLIGKNHDDY